MTEERIKATALEHVTELVRKFQNHEADYLRSVYNETQARTDFITPLLEAFGWDVYNRNDYALALREVIEEATVDVDEEPISKKPDYELRLARQRKFFVEAKKPHVRIGKNREAAFQARRYGYSANLPIVVLTNFYQLAIYDCLPKPTGSDEVHVARILLVPYKEFPERFEELWAMLSRQAVYSGEFDARFAINPSRQGTEQFDGFFLGQVRSWRERLAADIFANTPGLGPTELTYVVQLFLLRIVFLRICEDREIERYETLKNLPASNTFNALIAQLRRADEFYDSGLFHLIDDDTLGVRISDNVLQEIINELYYPKSPYTFSVVETEVLGKIYEQFLGEVISVVDGAVEIIYKPELRDSGGVVPTPRYIVDAIVERTLEPSLSGKSPVDLNGFTVADICCGSGVFLLSVYEAILNHYLTWYLSDNSENHIGRIIYEGTAGKWNLTFAEKRRILQKHIRGVDIDPNATDVARFSLLLKLIENETKAGLQEFVDTNRIPVLPLLDNVIFAGNSLVCQSEWTFSCGTLPPQLQEKINPFTWGNAFPIEMEEGGFHVIVGNPPYIRIQNMMEYSPEEVKFYKSRQSPYSTAGQDNFDKYALFIERALTLLRTGGRLGVIIPHKFMTIQAGRALRRLIVADKFLEEIVHFGIQQVFGLQVTNYTCILVLDRHGQDSVRVERVKKLETWRYGTPGQVLNVLANRFGEDTWQFADADTNELFGRVRVTCPDELGQVAEIFVGVQTSADKIYIFTGIEENLSTVSLSWNNRNWPIERALLRPCLLDVQLLNYARPQANAWMIFPYELISDGIHNSYRLIQPETMARNYPGCWAYLCARQEELARRNIQGGIVSERQFYQFGRSQSLTKFSTPKIILPILSREARYAYDDANIMVTGGGNGPYYMIRSKPGANFSNFYLLAVLNHPLSEAFVRINTSPFRGGYYSHGKQYIEHLPIPAASDDEQISIGNLVEEIFAANNAANSARTPHQRTVFMRNAANLKEQIEARVSALFSLSENDMAIVRAVPIPE